MIIKLLFDFISIQGYINGGAEYAKRILHELYQYCDVVKLYALFDSKKQFMNNDNKTYHSYFLDWIDIRDRDLAHLCEEKKIDLLFINIAQRYFEYNIKNIQCRTIVVIHDLAGFERYSSKIPIKCASISKYLSYYIKRLLWKTGMYRSWRNGTEKDLFLKYRSFFEQDNVEIVTVSNFSKYSIRYNIPYMRSKKINVYYSPLRNPVPPIVIPEIEKLVDNNIPYFVGLCANRYNKNIKMAIDVVAQLNETYPEYKIVTTGNAKCFHKTHIALPYVSDGELTYLLSHAQALLYPTLIEGFGYPPLEAMRCGIPVICSNVSSLPEVVGNGAITFSPLYATELYQAILKFLNSDFNQLKEKSIKRYNMICLKQKADLRLLIEQILKK